MNTPITKRMQMNRHLAQKKSVAKQTAKEIAEKKKEEDKKPAITGPTQDASGNLTTSTGTGNDGKLIKGAKVEKFAETEEEKAKYAAYKKKCLAEGNCNDKYKDKKTDPSSDATHTPVVTEAKDRTPGSIVNTFTSSEMRNTIKKNKKANRYVEKAANSLNRSKWFNKYLPIFSSDEKVESKQAELEFAKQLRDTSSDANKAGMNRFITQQYEFLGPDGKLTGRSRGSKGGEPVKAPEGTESQSDFETRNSGRFSVDAGSSMNAAGTTGADPLTTSKPGTVTTQPTNFSTLAANSEVKVGTGNLFGNLGLFTGNNYQKGQGQGPGAFKMKGYGSKK